MNTFIEYLYLASGVILPMFYLPQILRFRNDSTLLASYSLSKSVCQLLLRAPALLFALFVVQNGFMNFVLGLDLLGRAAELAMAVHSLRRQGLGFQDVFHRMIPAAWNHGDAASHASPMAHSSFGMLPQSTKAPEGGVPATTPIV